MEHRNPKCVSESPTKKVKMADEAGSVKYVFILSSRQTLGLWFIAEQS